MSDGNESDKAPRIIPLRTQHVSDGYTRIPLANSDLMHFHIMSYGRKSGENALHAHRDEDHAFVVLEGEARFRGRQMEPTVVTRNDMIFLPKDTYYAFSNNTDGPLVMLRVGASELKPDDRRRLDADGKPIKGRSQPQTGVKMIDGSFFE